MLQTHVKDLEIRLDKTVGFAEELRQPMKSLEENEHMVRCEIQISASKKSYILFPNQKKNTQIKFQVNICTLCLALTVYFIKCLLKARKSSITIASIMQEIFLAKSC